MCELALRRNLVVYGSLIISTEGAETSGTWSLSLAALAATARSAVEGSDGSVICENAAMSSCAQALQWLASASCLRSLQDASRCKASCGPSAVSFATAMTATTSEGWHLPLSLFTHLQTLRAVDAVSTSTVVRACSEHAVWQVAIEFVMSPSGIKAINEVSFHIALEACSQNCNWEQSIGLLQCMQRATLQVSAVPYAAAIRACGFGGQWQIVLALLESMRNSKLALDEATRSCVINAFACGGHWELALDFFKSSLKGSREGADMCTRDLVSYTAAIAACERGSQWQRALELLETFESFKETPDTVMFNAAISAAQSGARWEVSLSQLGRMQTLTVRVDAVTQNTVLSACEVVSFWQLAVGIFREACTQNLQLGEVGHNALTSSLEKSMKWLITLLCLEEQLQVASLPGQIAMDAAASAIQKSSHWHMAIEQITRTGWNVDVSSIQVSYSWQDFAVSTVTGCSCIQCCHQRLREEPPVEGCSGP